MSETPYVVAIKRSARRTSRAAGQWLNREGTRRTFASKALAREWARDLSGPHARLWIQDAPPSHETDADGYLVGVQRDRAREFTTDTSSATDDDRQTDLAGF